MKVFDDLTDNIKKVTDTVDKYSDDLGNKFPKIKKFTEGSKLKYITISVIALLAFYTVLEEDSKKIENKKNPTEMYY